MAARQRNTFSTLVLKIGTTFLTAALRKTEFRAKFDRPSDILSQNIKTAKALEPLHAEMGEFNYLHLLHQNQNNNSGGGGEEKIIFPLQQCFFTTDGKII
jgi:hypothetical protein